MTQVVEGVTEQGGEGGRPAGIVGFRTMGTLDRGGQARGEVLEADHTADPAGQREERPVATTDRVPRPVQLPGPKH